MFAMYLAGLWYSLTALDAPKRETDDPIASLDVSVLHDRLIAPVLNVGDPRTDARVDFVGGIRGLTELAQRVDTGSAAVAFALHPPSMDELMAVADRGLADAAEIHVVRAEARGRPAHARARLASSTLPFPGAADATCCVLASLRRRRFGPLDRASRRVLCSESSAYNNSGGRALLRKVTGCQC